MLQAAYLFRYQLMPYQAMVFTLVSVLVFAVLGLLQSFWCRVLMVSVTLAGLPSLNLILASIEVQPRVSEA